MTGRDSPETAAPLEVLYYDADPEARRHVHRHEAWEDLTVDAVEDAGTALDRLEGSGYDVLVIDPASLTLEEEEALVGTIDDDGRDVSVVLFTDSDSSELDESLLSATDTLVEKGTLEEGISFLRDKVAAAATRSEDTGAGMLDSYEVLVEAARDGIYILGGDGRFQYANQSMADLVGYDTESLVGMHASLVMAPGELERGQALIQEMVSAGETESEVFDMRFRTKDGEEIVVGLNFSIIYDDGRYAGIVGVARDVTARIEDKAELESQNERLEEFASIVSHDLRNPLNVAQGRVELARAECDSEHLEEAVDAIDRSLALIEGLLTLAREGDAASDLEVVDLEAIVDGCWSNVETDDATLVTGNERSIRADPGRLKRLLENLMRNAVDHGGDGVTVTIGDLADGFYVADDGPGIPDGERGTVFETGYSTTDDGTGFGLDIVETIVEAHEWSIAVTEADGGGARFEITGVDVVE